VVQALKTWRAQQAADRLAWGRDWIDNGLVFTREDGSALHPEAFVIGGGGLYREALPLADRIYLTELPAEYSGDVFFPPLPPDEWRFGRREIHAAEGDQPAWSFVICERQSAD
jgi:dihydrofolate reductase